MEFSPKYTLMAKRLVLLSQVAYNGKLLLLFAFALSVSFMQTVGSILMLMMICSSVASLVADIISDRWFEQHADEAVRQKSLRDKIALTGVAHIAVSLIMICAVIGLRGLGWEHVLAYPAPLAISAVLQMFPKVWGADQKKQSRLSWAQQAWIIVCIFTIILPYQL